ncbi:receptor-like protein kinase ANXUR2, partial [Trifolium pratense]
PWLDETPLCERFGRLYVLSETKSFTVAEMFTLGWGLDGAAWVWRRLLRAWEEEMLGECQSLLSNMSLQAHITDRWQWQPDPDIGPFEGLHLCVALIAGQVAYKVKPDFSRHSVFCST